MIAESEAELQRLQSLPTSRPVGTGDIAGPPALITERLLEAIDQGAQRITLHFCDAPRPEGAWLFAATVLPHLFN